MIIFLSILQITKGLLKQNLELIIFRFAGDRTFGVLTKIDLMDKGTDAVDVSSIVLIST